MNKKRFHPRIRVGNFIAIAGILIAEVLFGVSGSASGQDFSSVPTNTPSAHKSAAIAFVRKRAQALGAVETLLNQQRELGSSAGGGIRSIRNLESLIDKNVAAIERDIAKVSGEEKVALEGLLKNYKAEAGNVGGAMVSANKMLEAHDTLYRAIEEINQQKARVLKHRAGYEFKTNMTTNFLKAVGKTPLPDLIDELIANQTGSRVEFKEAYSYFVTALSETKAHQILIEKLDSNMDRDIDALDAYLKKEDPTKWAKFLGNSGDRAMDGAPKPWSTYHDKWLKSLKSNLGQYETAYRDFKGSAYKPMTELQSGIIVQLKSELKGMKEFFVRDLAAVADQLGEEEKRYKEALEMLDDAQKSKRRLKAEIASCEKLDGIYQKKLSDLDSSNFDEQDEFEEAQEFWEYSIETNNERLDEFRSSLKETESIIESANGVIKQWESR